MKKTFKHYMEEAKKQPKSDIPPLDKRYGTPQDPRLDIHSDEAYKQSGSGTGIFRAGMGHSPYIYGAKNLPKEPTAPLEKPKSQVLIKKSETSLDTVQPRMTFREIGDKFDITKARAEQIAKTALQKLAAGLLKNKFKPSDFTPEIRDPTPEESAAMIERGEAIKRGEEQFAKNTATRARSGKLSGGEQHRQRRLKGQ
jgi:hypothetical protein